MDNHWTNECRSLTTAQKAVTQAKNRYRSDQNQNSNQANFGSNPVWSKPAQPSADHTAQRKKNFPMRMTHRK